MRGERTAKLMIDNLEAGDYGFRLTVVDNLGQSDRDDVNLRVEGSNTNFTTICNSRRNI